MLEWCKLFADRRGAHCWNNVLTDPLAFQAALLAHLNVSLDDFEQYCADVRRYRDKFVAHLDDNPTGRYPNLDLAIESTKFLFKYLLEHEDGGGYFEGLARNPGSAYRVALSDAKRHYEDA